ncbi:ABC transporter permease [Chitinivorax sp. B]|uniref:ABC transporter permease n=1 Tax=Chitinivorax sp. B TaxID=2502235 RepID=UPI0010F8576C|nr:ABC transporter permease [Chitinivorax sp. B]
MSDAKSFWNPYALLDASQRRWLGILAVLVVLMVWSALAGSGLVGPNKLPAPWQVAKALTYLVWDGERQTSLLLTATLWSVGRVLAAGVLVLMIGIPVGVLMGASPRVNATLSPLIDPFRSAPVVALLPIMVMWFGIGEWMKILFLFVGAVVYLIPMVRDAVRAVPQAYWISARDLGATPWEAVRHSVLPLSMPRIADAVIVSVSVMWTYITVAEYVNAQEGLGQLIQNARRFSAMDQVFAGIIVIIALALATYQGMQYAKRRLYPWETQL